MKTIKDAVEAVQADMANLVQLFYTERIQHRTRISDTESESTALDEAIKSIRAYLRSQLFLRSIAIEKSDPAIRLPYECHNGDLYDRPLRLHTIDGSPIEPGERYNSARYELTYRPSEDYDPPVIAISLRVVRAEPPSSMERYIYNVSFSPFPEKLKLTVVATDLKTKAAQ